MEAAQDFLFRVDLDSRDTNGTEEFAFDLGALRGEEGPRYRRWFMGRNVAEYGEHGVSPAMMPDNLAG